MYICMYALRSQDWHHDHAHRIELPNYRFRWCSTPVPNTQRRNSPKVPSGEPFPSGSPSSTAFRVLRVIGTYHWHVIGFGCSVHHYSDWFIGILWMMIIHDNALYIGENNHQPTEEFENWSRMMTSAFWYAGNPLDLIKDKGNDRQE